MNPVLIVSDTCREVPDAIDAVATSPSGCEFIPLTPPYRYHSVRLGPALPAPVLAIVAVKVTLLPFLTCTALVLCWVMVRSGSGVTRNVTVSVDDLAGLL